MRGGGVDASSHSVAALSVGLVAEGVGQRFRRMLVEDGVTGSVQLGVQVAQRQRPSSLAQECEAESSEFSTDDQDRICGDRRKRGFVADVSTASAPTRCIRRADLVVELFGTLEEFLPAGAAIQHLLIELADLLTYLVFLGDELTDAMAANGLPAYRHEIAAVNIGMYRIIASRKVGLVSVVGVRRVRHSILFIT